MSRADLWSIATIAGMTLITVLTRCLFFLSNKPWPLPAWASSGLKYAPIAALAAVVVPEVVTDAGHMVAGDRNDIFAGAVIDFLHRVVPVSGTPVKAPHATSPHHVGPPGDVTDVP